MTIAERLKQEGQAEGRMEGRIEGRMKGRVEGRVEGRMEGEKRARLEIALAMLKKGIDPAIITETTGLTREALAKIKH